MTNLVTGQLAPEFVLKSLDGKEHSLRDHLSRGPAVLAFFKISCPVCQFTFPFLQRLHERFNNANVSVVGISQDDDRPTRHFNKDYGVSFLTLLDAHPYGVSNSYGLTNVPTILLLEPDRTITVSSTGFNKDDLDRIAAHLAERNHLATQPLFASGEVVPDYKPG